jgi:haloalkane dehalogenase
MAKNISADFPFQSNFLEINGNQMHYIDEGEGDPVLFLHGNPTSSYLWRNIIPYLTGSARCIAPDLIGMGKSDKADVAYRFADHYDYLKNFIQKLALTNITLVLHDWGSALGFHYASKHPENIKAICFMEAIYKIPKWAELPAKPKLAFKMLRTPGLGWLMVSVLNLFVKKILPDLVVRKLTTKEQEIYSEPYPTIRSRKPLRVWPEEVPFDGRPEDVSEAVESYHNWLKKTQIPKLCFYAKPGLLLQKEDAKWISENYPHTKTVFLGKGLHYLQEDHPHRIGEELETWYNSLEE